MRLLPNLLFKATLSSMILTAPAMRTASSDDAGLSTAKEGSKAFHSVAVIHKFVDHLSVTAMKAVMLPEHASATAVSSLTATRTAELRVVIDQAALLYISMDLENSGLDEKAFEYAWRGYHNLVKKRMIRKRSVLSICDFSQSSCSKRLYVIDVRHKRLLFRTYVAHGEASGGEYATSFSNAPDSYKSSLGFYVTERTYIGRNGLSLRLNGVDSGYNDKARERNIVLHGSSYVSDRYMDEYGTLGTSLGCPAIPSAVSGRIIRAVKGGSCLFIYHPTPQYLDNSPVINNG